MRSLIIVLIAIVAVVSSHQIASGQTQRESRRSTTTLSNSDISGGLKEALFQGVRSAINDLGRQNGFLDNARVRIPLPGGLQKTEKALRAAGQGPRVDAFIASMNHAAEKAVPIALDVFLDSIKQMTFTDARNILFSNQQDAATQFFRRTSEDRLREMFRPIVQDATEQVGVTQQYKAMMGKYGAFGKLFGQDATDLDGYITQKALDGLFLLIADQEAKIRKDPLGQTTSILRRVFGSIR